MYRTYALGQDPQDLFEKASNWLTTIRELQVDAVKGRIIEEHLVASMSEAIFGSNKIEHVGLGLDNTLKLCERIFNGEDIPDLDERSPEYEQKLRDMINRQKDLENMPTSSIVRSRREVVQHAKAFYRIIQAIVIENEPLSENLIREVHFILCKNISITHADGSETGWRAYAGKYRSIPVSAGNTMFTPPHFVPRAMDRMINNFNQDMAKIEQRQEIDPFAIASKYCHDFVMIHPFQDGNGRVCRMILNAILCKYAGIIVPIGEHDEERSEYMGIKQRASEQMEGAGELATFVLKRAKSKIRTLKEKLTKTTVRHEVGFVFSG